MSSGLLALLDDIAALAKVAAASLDDAAAQATKAGSKAAGIVIDDAAVTPRYVVGFAAERELPIIRKIAVGSLRNKMLFILPGAMALSLLAPWSITPILMVGGAYLCLEGYEKVMDLVDPSHAAAHGQDDDDTGGATTPEELENHRVQSAIRTDFILSAEIMAITLASVAAAPWWLQIAVLAIVGLLMTVLVYGAVALIVKADDWGAALALSGRGSVAALGRAVVTGMPYFLKGLSLVGMVAMLWVGGQIITHGLHVLGMHGPEDLVKSLAATAAAGLGPLKGVGTWLVGSGLSAVIGLVIGAVVAPLAHHLLVPLVQRLTPKRGVAVEVKP